MTATASAAIRTEKWTLMVGLACDFEIEGVAWAKLGDGKDGRRVEEGRTVKEG